MKKRLFSLILCLSIVMAIIPFRVFAAEIVASGTCGENLTWTLDSDGVLTISGEGAMDNYFANAPWQDYVDQTSSVIIEEGVTSVGNHSFNGFSNITNISIPGTVKMIRNFAFSECTSLRNVVIPDGTTLIGFSAFADCTNLSSVIISDSVTEIGGNAFSGCNSLSSVTIPSSVMAIGSGPFSYCENLNAIYVDENNEYFCNDDSGVLFDKNKKTLICAPGAISGQYTVSAGVTDIGDDAFSGCKNLTSVVLQDGVTRIGWSAFNGCSNLTTVTIPDSVRSIATYAFTDCSSLTSVTIPNSVSDFGQGVFSGCTSLTSISLSDSITCIEYDTFQGCSSLTNVLIPDGVTTIESSAFASCSSLVNVSIPDSVTIIGDLAFAWCSSLAHISIPDSVTSIEYFAFGGCSALSSVTIPNSVTSIGSSVFSSCSSLTNISIPNSVTSIGSGAFEYCSSLSSVFFTGDSPTFDESVFSRVTATAYYPDKNNTWTDDVMQNYGGTIEWVALGDLIGIEVIPSSTNYVVGDSIDVADLCVNLVYSNDARVKIDPSLVTVEAYDMSTIGRKTVTVTYDGMSASFEIAVHSEATTVELNPDYYPESKHNYANDEDETQVVYYPGAANLTLTFSDNTKTEANYDIIYVCDKNDQIIAQYSGTGAAGVSVTVPGDTAKIRLTSDSSANEYGYSFSSITVYTVVHTGDMAGTPVPATCTSQGRTAGIICDVCGLHVDYEVIPKLDHDYESVVTAPTPEADGFTTYTCKSCGDTYTDDVTHYYHEMVLDTDYAVVKGENQYYSFTPSQTGYYKLYTEDTSAHVYCYASDSEGNAFVVTWGNSAGSPMIYLPEIFKLTEGETYSFYFSAQSADSFTVEITEAPGMRGGENVYWTCEDGVLTFFGTGPMYNFGVYGKPWNKFEFTKVVIEDGVVNLDMEAFWFNRTLESVTVSGNLSIGGGAFYGCSNLKEIIFLGDAPGIPTSDMYDPAFQDVTATVYYPANNETWTDEVMQDYGGDLTWVALGDLIGIEVIPSSTNYVVGDSIDVADLCVNLVYSNDARVKIDPSLVTVEAYDTSTVGRKTVTVTYDGMSASFEIAVHSEATTVELNPDYYPESEHNYANDEDETQVVYYPGAANLTLTFSDNTKTEANYDIIYICDKNDQIIAQYSGTGAAGISVTVPGDTAKIRLTSDYSANDYGYSFSSITAYSVVHTGDTTGTPVAATCTSQGRTAGIICDVCGLHVDYEVIPKLDHDYESVVTAPTPEADGFTTYTCKSCGDSYTDDVTHYYHEMVLDTEYTVIIDSNKKYGYYSFTPAESGYYLLSSEYLHIQCIPYDSNNEILNFDPNTGAIYESFPVSFYLEEDNSYYFDISTYYYAYDKFSFELSKTTGYVGGKNVIWNCQNNVLTFTGTGDMYGYENYGAPWSKYEYDSIVIEDGITNIGARVFAGDNLTSVVIADSVTNIDNYAFEMSSISEIVLPDALFRIGGGAFSGTNLERIVIPSSVEEIEMLAFGGCNDLTEIVFTGDAPEYLSGTAFYGVTATAYYPAGNETWTEEKMYDYDGAITWIAVEAEPENPFADVPEGSFYDEPVLWAVEKGITNGATETTFNPDGTCLRAQVVTFLHRAAGNPAPTTSNNPFTDVKNEDFFYKPVLWAVENSVTNGTSATTFGAYDNCNRAAVVTFLWRAAGSPEPTSTSNPFEDVNTTDFFYKAVLWAVENGITNGVDATHFGPTNPCNRAQVVTFLYRTMA